MPKSRVIIHRVDAAFSKWLKTEPLENPAAISGIPSFTWLSFNEKSGLEQLLQLSKTVSWHDGQLLLHIPAFDPVQNIKAPANKRQVRFSLR